MKNRLFIYVAIVFATGILSTGCNAPGKKVETSQEKIEAAQQNVAEANQALKDAIEQFKKESEETITENEKSIAAFKVQNKAISEKKLAELELKNKELKEKLANYKADGNEQWETFKAEFSRDIDELGKVFGDSTVSSVN
jgi:predicted RNase H-like nuclease (RuvC/YqgF family)